MTFNKTILALFSAATLFISCNKESEFKEYEGTWTGSYSGDDTGTWEVSIDDEGNATGTAVSDSMPSYTMVGEGQISESGDFSANVKYDSLQVEFIGKAKDGSVSGTWQYVGEGFSGTWEGKKN